MRRRTGNSFGADPDFGAPEKLDTDKPAYAQALAVFQQRRHALIRKTFLGIEDRAAKGSAVPIDLKCEDCEA